MSGWAGVPRDHSEQWAGVGGCAWEPRTRCLPAAVEVVGASLPELYVEKVLEFLAASMETSRHLEFYLLWTQRLLLRHGHKLKAR